MSSANEADSWANSRDNTHANFQELATEPNLCRQERGIFALLGMKT